MNINNVYANIKLIVPDATTAEMNKYLLAELDRLNATGIESVWKQQVIFPPDPDESEPPEKIYLHERIYGQGFNYYPEQRCFVLPPEIIHVAEVYINQQMASYISHGKLMRPSQLYLQYNLTETGEMYFSTALKADDVITIVGRIGGQTFDTLSDRYVPLFSNVAIASLLTIDYPNLDLALGYIHKVEKAEIAAKGRLSQPRGNNMRNGRLY